MLACSSSAIKVCFDRTARRDDDEGNEEEDDDDDDDADADEEDEESEADVVRSPEEAADADPSPC